MSVCKKKKSLSAVGFEPTSANTVELESTPLDRSGTLTNYEATSHQQKHKQNDAYQTKTPPIQAPTHPRSLIDAYYIRTALLVAIRLPSSSFSRQHPLSITARPSVACEIGFTTIFTSPASAYAHSLPVGTVFEITSRFELVAADS